jgi:hypothetical protein
LNKETRTAEVSAAKEAPAILCDAVQSLAVHNGVVRIVFSRLTPQGDGVAALELLLPIATLPSVLAVLQSVRV